jgi:O-acetyl-ADP-ribose deacetylase (regulator of RNase III)
MIKVVDGDILLAKEEIIGQQVNCMSVMGSGLAKQIRAKHSNVYTEYKLFCELYDEPIERLGKVNFVEIEEGKYIANLFGQIEYGRNKSVQYTDYKGLYQALKMLKHVAKFNEMSVALPYNIGCGLANGDWDTVYDMIERAFNDYEVTLYKYSEV